MSLNISELRIEGGTLLKAKSTFEAPKTSYLKRW